MAKNSNGNKFWLKLLVGVGIVLMGFAVGYGMLNQKVENNCETIKIHNEKIDTCERAVIEQGRDIKHIMKTTEKILEKLEKD
jgi:hypothetical protein